MDMPPARDEHADMNIVAFVAHLKSEEMPVVTLHLNGGKQASGIVAKVEADAGGNGTITVMGEDLAPTTIKIGDIKQAVVLDGQGRPKSF
jgi:hypothetical protein